MGGRGKKRNGPQPAGSSTLFRIAARGGGEERSLDGNLRRRLQRKKKKKQETRDGYLPIKKAVRDGMDPQVHLKRKKKKKRGTEPAGGHQSSWTKGKKKKGEGKGKAGEYHLTSTLEADFRREIVKCPKE